MKARSNGNFMRFRLKLNLVPGPHTLLLTLICQRQSLSREQTYSRRVSGRAVHGYGRIEGSEHRSRARTVLACDMCVKKKTYYCSNYIHGQIIFTTSYAHLTSTLPQTHNYPKLYHKDSLSHSLTHSLTHSHSCSKRSARKVMDRTNPPPRRSSRLTKTKLSKNVCLWACACVRVCVGVWVGVGACACACKG